MKVLSIIPEKIHVTFSMDTDELLKLSKALTMCELKYNGENQEDTIIKDFFVNDFSKLIDDLIKELLEN